MCLDQEVEAQFVTTGFERFRLIHQALPEMALADVNLHCNLLGKCLELPIVISAMTGGTPWAGHINQSLAAAAQATGVAMSVGSQRTAIDNPSLAYSYEVRDVAPEVLLMANVGAVQLNYGYGIDQCKAAVEMIGADALVLHLNPLQEALQLAGNTNFTGLLHKIEAVCQGLAVPVVVKEVGFGISPEVALQLQRAGVAAIDVSGAGGTSWSEVERHRMDTEAERHIAAAFSAWGIPTAEAIRAVRSSTPGTALIGSGGVRTAADTTA
ncbi:MAG: type 2 isopentenyl-diphosphate Delta-isomerase, partial [Chloroflexi bacterium]|nr:type 2 isopentenyl-diphosphate Delta-isomerase [Chloroflexota bacterium]